MEPNLLKQRARAEMTRRTFVKLTAGTGLGIGAMSLHSWAAETKSNGMLYRTLGATGEKVSAIGLGGFHIGNPLLESEGIKIIRSAIDRGITFMYNCWDYHDGKSEVRMGKALRDGYRDKVFLMTKIDGRSKAGAAAQLDESLKRLQTDRIDLIQFHEIIRMDDPDKVFAPGGALDLKQASWELSLAECILTSEFGCEISAPAARMASLRRLWATDRVGASQNGF